MEKLTLKQWCEVSGRQDLLDAWDEEQNAPLTPEQALSQSHRKVWWKDPLGHSWSAQIRSRVNGSGCPYCTGRRILPGFNDLTVTHPDLAAQWHPVKNGGLTPDHIGHGSQLKVWWQCENGHPWQATVLSRTHGNGCPYCANKAVTVGENDLASFKPELAAEWHPTKNGDLRPEDVVPQSNRRVWWKCPKGHEYKSIIAQRSNYGRGCPYCAGQKVLAGFNDLKTLEPELAKEWHSTLNGALTPDQVTKGSSKKVWWRCQFGHVWQAIVFSRTGQKRSGCPECAGRISHKRRGMAHD